MQKKHLFRLLFTIAAIILLLITVLFNAEDHQEYDVEDKPDTVSYQPRLPNDNNWPIDPLSTNSPHPNYSGQANPVSAKPSYSPVEIVPPADLPYHIRRETITGPDGNPKTVEMVADHILAHLKLDMRQNHWPDVLSENGITLGAAINSRGLYRIHVNPNDPQAIPRALKLLNEFPHYFRYAEPDYIVYSFFSPDDPRYIDGSLWGLMNKQHPGADIHAEDGWKIRNDAATVIVGIVDSGIRLTHEDLIDNLWVNPNEIADGTDTDGNGFIDDIHGINAITLSGDPTDDQGHGTHVAGTVGAVGNNGIGVTGVAWNVQLMGLKFLASAGGGTTSDAIICIDYAVENGAHILNNSWGGSFFSQALMDAVENARDAGVIFVAAAGNASSDNDVNPIFPASLPLDNVVTVSSTSRNDVLSSFSNYGQGFVDIAAPGNEILSVGNDNDQHYRSLNGTSMAAPHVAGALALMRAEFPEDNYGQLINRLYRSVDRIANLAGGVVGSEGRLNLANSLTYTDNRPFNDDFSTSRTIHGDVVLLRTQNFGATSGLDDLSMDENHGKNNIWFSYTPESSGLASVSAPESFQFFNPLSATSVSVQLNSIATDISIFVVDEEEDLIAVDAEKSAEEWSFTVEGQKTYHIAVAGKEEAEGLIMLEVVGPPRNNDIANATPLTIRRNISATNRNADAEPDEPDHADQPAQASIWFKWTANLTAKVGFSTRGSSINTVAAVYSGPAENITMAELTKVGANVSVEGATFSRIDFQAISGVTYYFAVDGWQGAQGIVSALLAVPPSNDDFSNSLVLTGTSIQRSVSTVFATREPGEPRHLPGRGNGESVWFTWTAPESSRVTLTSSGSFLPCIIAVYTGDRLEDLALVSRDGANNRPTRITMDAVQGTTYRIAIEAWDFSLSDMPFRLESTPIPPNENFADATILQGQRVTVTGNNAGAGRENGEPSNNYNGSGSVWYTWTAPTTGEFAIYGERLDKPRRRAIVLNIFRGNKVDELTHVKEDFGNGIGFDAFVRWNAVAGTTYHIQVTSLNESFLVGGEGPFSLDLRPRHEHAPANDNFANAIELDGNLVYNFRTHTYGLTAEPGEPAHAGLTATETLWWKFQPQAGQAGRYAISTAMSEGAWLTTVYQVPNTSTPSFANLTEVANNYASADMAFPDLAWHADVGNTYYIVHERAQGSRGRFIFHFHKVPDNYRFSGAQEITSDRANIIAHNWGSIRQTNEPTLGANASRLGSRSLWWKWTAPYSGRFQLDTVGSETPVNEDNAPHPERTILGFDTRLGVFTGTTISNLHQVTQNDSVSLESYGNSWLSFTRNSRVEFDASEGTTYYFLVNGENIDSNGTVNQAQTNTGRIRLNLAPLTPPTNSTFAGAKEIIGTEYHIIQPTFGSGKEPGEPNHAGISGGRSLWWKWTAPESGPIVVSTAGNLYDDFHARRTGLGVYTGNSVNGLSLVTSDQNGAGMNVGDNTWSAAKFEAIEGITYYFGVDAAHPGNLSFLLARPAANDDFTNATEMVGSRWVSRGHNLMTSNEIDEPRLDQLGYFNVPDNNFRSVWYRWTAPVDGEITLSSMGSESVNLIGVFTGDRVNALTPISDFPRSGGNPFNGDAERRARDGNNRGVTRFVASAGTTYYITLQGSGFIEVSSGPYVLSLSGPPAIPFAPENFSTFRVNQSRIDLFWQDIAVDEEYYEIERSLDTLSWEPLAQIGPNSEAYSDFDTADEDEYFYRIRAANSVGTSDWINSYPVTPTEYWRSQHFSQAELSNPNLESTLWGDTADPDGDGIPNLLEFALQGNPHQPHTARLPATETIQIAGKTYIFMHVDKNIIASDIVYQIETSNDLENWESGADNIQILVDNLEKISARAKLPAEEINPIFLRLRVLR